MKLNLSTFSSKNLMNNKILKIVTFIILMAVIGSIIGYVFEMMHKKNIVENYDLYAKWKRWDDYYRTDKNVDVLFLGSSHAYVSYDPEIFDRKLSINSFNFGTPSQEPNMGYYILKEVIKKNKPRLLVYDIFWTKLQNEITIGQVLSNYEFIKSPDVRNEIYKNLFSTLDKVEYTFPAIRYRLDFSSYMNRIVNKVLKIPYMNFEFEYKSKGYVFSEKVVDSETLNHSTQFISNKYTGFNAKQIEYLDKTLQLCERNNIKVIFVTSPVPPSILYSIKNEYGKIHADVEKIADKYNIEYIDFNIENENKKIVTDSNFGDDNHLNLSGAKIVSDYLSDYILENQLIDKEKNRIY